MQNTKYIIGWLETIKILAQPSLRQKIRIGLEDISAGRTVTLQELKDQSQ